MPTTIRSMINRARSRGNGKDSNAPVLLPLTPKYDPDKHGVYSEVIEAALSDPQRLVRNIALTGSYGVGKSSILTEVARRHERGVISISLSTLGLPNEEPLSEGDAATAASTKTNRIQKEIVKQLLYSQDPLKTPGSRYRRTTRFRFWRTLSLSALLAIPIVLVFFLAGWTESIAASIPGTVGPWWLGHVAVFAASTLLLVGFFAAFHNRFQIEKFGAGAATISLSVKSATYFDEYLDEIVYFFEVVNRDIVIFEDIDRFDDAHIFETLRSLNSILNGAKQLKGRKIRFIYAIKDSIFDELGTRAAKEELVGNDASNPEAGPGDQRNHQDAAEAEVARANRTKFFDLVVPVVPFITHRSARDLLVQTLGQELQHGVSEELIDLTARHVADMRLIKNIRNEFAIFKHQIIDGGNLELTQDGLFAMVLYKSTHLSDFELIKLGKSNLDRLYRDGRSLVASSMRVVNATVRSDRARLRKLSIAAADAQRLGDRLSAHIARTLRHLGVSAQNAQRSMAGQELDDATLRTPEFWEDYASRDVTIEVRVYRSPYGFYDVLNFARGDVSEALGHPIDSAVWAAAERARLDEAVAKSVADRDFLSHADMGDLMKRGEFKLEVGDEQLSFSELVKRHLTSELAVQLVEGGYIDRSFTLYTSTFYTDRVSATATNYILKNVDPNTTDMHFELEPQDVAAILRERGRAVLNERAAYNVSVLDYLVASDPVGLDVVLTRLRMAGEEERELMLTYLDTGKHASEFVASLTPRWEGTFTFLVSDAGVEDQARLALIDTALRAAGPETKYKTDGAVREYLVTSYRDIDVFTSDSTSIETATRVADLVRAAGARLPSLAGLAPAIERAVVRTGGYVVTRENLLIALGDAEHPLALDAIRGKDEDVYGRVLKDLDRYLVALGAEQPTIVHSSEFSSILEDVLEAGVAALPMVIQRSAAGCAIVDLSTISIDAWAPLADDARFPPTFANVKAYIDQYGLDGHLARRLTASGVVELVDSADEKEKTGVALAILGARDEIPSPEIRAKLAGSLDLKSYIEVSAIEHERGEFIGWLIGEEIVGDNADSFAAIQDEDIEGLAFAVSKSEDFATFMTSAHVTPAKVGLLIDHDLVPDKVKEALVDRFTEFTAGTSRSGLTSIARFAVDRGRTLSFDGTARLAREGVDPKLVLALLERQLATVNIAQLGPVLVSLGGEYEKLSSANGKRPRIPNTPANRALVDRLKQLGVVSSATVRSDEIRVNMKQW